MKKGLILEGGGLRGLFTAGAVDALMENNVEFEYIIGVSAGGGNALNYKSHQIGRTKNVMMPENRKLNAFGKYAFKRSGRLIDLDMIYETFPYKHFPFDFESYYSSDKECEYVAVNCLSGEAEYLSENSDNKRLGLIGKATCCVPLVCKPVVIDGVPYLDGSIVDSLPVKHAFEKGCDKQFVIFTREEKTMPTDYRKMKGILKVVFRKYPNLLDAFWKRFDRYFEQLDYLKKMEKEGKVYVLRPEIESISKSKPDYEADERFYNHGYEIMKRKMPELQEFLRA